MLNVERFVCNMFQENTFIVSDESNECAIIDCGALYDSERQAVINFIETAGLTPVKLLCTHGHIDHYFGCMMINEAYGLLPEVSAADQFLIEKMQEQTQLFAMLGDYEEAFPPVGRYFDHGDNIKFGNHTLEVLATPGHTPGSVFFYCREEGVAFSGDTLFQMSIGRTDFERGSFPDIMNSLHNVVAKLPEETVVYTGHGPKTTIGRELTYNPYMRG